MATMGHSVDSVRHNLDKMVGFVHDSYLGWDEDPAVCVSCGLNSDDGLNFPRQIYVRGLRYDLKGAASTCRAASILVRHNGILVLVC